MVDGFCLEWFEWFMNHCSLKESLKQMSITRKEINKTVIFAMKIKQVLLPLFSLLPVMLSFFLSLFLEQVKMWANSTRRKADKQKNHITTLFGPLLRSANCAIIICLVCEFVWENDYCCFLFEI